MESNNVPAPAVEAVAQIKAVQTIEQYSGPIPSAIEMSRYSQVSEDLPGRIMSMAEKQAEHRHSIESEALYQRKLGAWLAFVISVFALGCGTFCIIKGQNASGLSMIIAELAVLVGAFVYGHYRKAK